MARSRAHGIAALLLLGVALACGIQATSAQASSGGNPPPNFLVIFTDDQDAEQGSVLPEYMPALDRLIRKPGVELDQYFVTTPVCCPSRTNLWRGQFAHNTNFTDVLSPHGGYAKWKALGIDQNYLPTWLQDLGYNTYYVGKFLVDYSVNNYNNTPRGWNDIDALVVPFTFDYFTPTFSRNGQTPVQYPGQYSTDVIADKAEAQLRSALAAGKPFYAQVSPIAPHTSTQVSSTPDPVTGRQRSYFYPPIPAPRHWQLFSDATLPDNTQRRNLYERDVSDKPAWIRALPLAQQNNRTYLEEVYRLRLRSLASVDELIERLVNVLDQAGVLNNTYIIYTSDNGYHIGTHRFGAGKVLSYDEELRVPFIIRGPGISPASGFNSKVGLHVDFAPTILSLANGTIHDKQLDGTPLGIYANANDRLPDSYPRPERHRNQFQGEFWGGWSDEVLHHLRSYPNNTWKSVRVWNEDNREGWKLIVSCTGERELYNLRRDPGELNNLFNQSAYARHLSRLEGLLAVLAVCKGDSCTHPWRVLHPEDTVQDFWDAIQQEYDEVYNVIPPFNFVRCLNYQDASNEISIFRDYATYGPDLGHPARRLAQTRKAEHNKASRKLFSGIRASHTEEPITFVAPIEKYGKVLPEGEWDLEGHVYPSLENKYLWA